MHYDVIIVGAGAAGLMCGIQCGKRNRRTLIVDHGAKVGAKILISGGGRCNFTNIGASPREFVSRNEHFCKSALTRYGPEQFIELVKHHGIAYHEKKLGQLFCDRSARDIVQMLERECELASVEIKIATSIKQVAQKIQPRSHGPQYRFAVDVGEEHTCESLVVATGGLSIPSLGASGLGYEIARQFGLSIVPTHPALDGFVLDPSEPTAKGLRELAGISIDCIVNCRGHAFRENVLFTHKGLSGPAALQASLYWNAGDDLYINWIPGHNLTEYFQIKKREKSQAHFKNLLGNFLPARFVDYFCAGNSQFQMPVTQISDRALQTWLASLMQGRLRPSATVGYSKAEVTRGGVDTAELSSKTMESSKVPGLYFVGEVVDVTGWLGGYNFQWAWASGWAAGQCA